MHDMQDVHIAIETMAGKGSEIGYTFDHIAYLIKHAKYGDHIGVCMGYLSYP